MNVLDTGNMYYQNQALKVPEARRDVTETVYKMKKPAAIDKDSKLYEQCQEFESLFTKMMLTEMKKSVSKSGLVDGGAGEEIFSDMLYDEYSKVMSKTAGFGLADQIYRQLES